MEFSNQSRNRRKGLAVRRKTKTKEAGEEVEGGRIVVCKTNSVVCLWDNKTEYDFFFGVG